MAPHPNSIALSDPILEAQSSGGIRSYQAARLRLLVAIPAATVLASLAAGVLGIHCLRNFEREVEATAFDQAFVALAAGVIVIAGLAALTGVAIARSLLRPLGVLIEHVTALAQGQFAEPPCLAPSNEVGELGVRFNAMLKALTARAQAKSQVIMEQFAGALITLDAAGQITAVNAEAVRLFGMEREALLGQTLVPLLSADGSCHEILHTIAAGQEVARRSVQVTVNGRHRELLVSATPERNAFGLITGSVINLRDVSEIEAFHSRMRETEQFAALSTFAAGVAHEVRNPLASIKGIAQLLGEDASADTRTARFTEAMTKEIDRLDQIVTELQAFTLLPAKARQAYDLASLVREAIALAVHRFQTQHGAEELQVTEDLRDVGCVGAVPERLLQALFQVVYNALDHSGGRGNVSVRLLRGSASEAIIEVQNTGSRIAPEHRDQLFTPFFTTKAAGPGLGLAVARQVLTQHQGSIELAATSPHVVFRIHLPLWSSTPQHSSEPLEALAC